MNITNVQQWVAAILLIAVAGIGMSVPLAYVSTILVDDAGRHDDAIGLWVMSMVVGALTAQAAWLLHGHRSVSPWLPVGVLPAAVAAFWLF